MPAHATFNALVLVDPIDRRTFDDGVHLDSMGDTPRKRCQTLVNAHSTSRDHHTIYHTTRPESFVVQGRSISEHHFEV